MSRANLIYLTVITGLGLTGCIQNNGSCPQAPNRAKGFSLSPRGFPDSYDRLEDFFVEIQNFNDSGVLWSGAWRDDAQNGGDAGQIPEAANLLQTRSRTYCFVPSVVFGWRSGAELHIKIPSNSDNTWLNLEARNAFLEMLTSYVSLHRPPYVFLGNENDFYYEQSLLDYANWLNFYNSAYDTIKLNSPETKVGPVFNFEHLAGSGQLNGWVTAYWEALLNHDSSRIDVIGLTLYPFFHIQRPTDIPNDYLDPLWSRISKPVAILETGWPAQRKEDFNPLWEVSEQYQVDYLEKLEVLLANKDVPIMNWLFLYEMESTIQSDETNIFGSISLRTSENTPRLVWPYWLEL